MFLASQLLFSLFDRSLWLGLILVSRQHWKLDKVNGEESH